MSKYKLPNEIDTRKWTKIDYEKWLTAKGMPLEGAALGEPRQQVIACYDDYANVLHHMPPILPIREIGGDADTVYAVIISCTVILPRLMSRKVN